MASELHFHKGCSIRLILNETKGAGTVGCFVKVKLARNVRSISLLWTIYHALMPSGRKTIRYDFEESSSAAGDTLFTRAELLGSDCFPKLGETQHVTYNIDVHFDVLDIQFYS